MSTKEETQTSKDGPFRNNIVVGCVNFMPVLGDKDANIDKMTRLISEAKKMAVDLLVFPEMALTGYEVDAKSLAEAIPGPSIARLSKAIEGKSLYLVFGMPERGGNDRNVIYNTAVVLGPKGILGSYRKMHPFGGELEWATPGRELPLVQTDFGPVGVGICFDHYVFPEVARSYSVKGCRLIINPSAAGHFQGITDVPEAVMNQLKARVIENSVFLASANCVGVENPTEFFGQSVILGPKPGSVAYQIYAGPASDKEEELITAELDLTRVDQFGYMKQRQPACYGYLTSTE